jgi:pimeloyl-ACP methyl ester carboxylesterase
LSGPALNPQADGDTLKDMKRRLTLMPLLALFTSVAMADPIGSSAGIPHPISALPDFQCTESLTGENNPTCLEKAQRTLQESLVGLDVERAEHPDLSGPSSYWGQSEYTTAPTRVPTVAILMHGMFEDGRQLAPEAAWLTKHGIPVLNVVLAGHGLTNEFANEVTSQDWIEEAERAMRLARAMGDRVILVGHSTGGALSAYLGIKYPDSVAAAILVEPAIRVSTLVQTGACVSQHGIKNVADYPALLKVYGVDSKELHNRIIAPSAGCEVREIRSAALALLSRNLLQDSDKDTIDERWGHDEFDQSRALGRAFRAPLLLFNNKHDIVVDPEQNEAFAEGVSLRGSAKTISFNLDRKTPHGSITFKHVDWIVSELEPFLAAHGLLSGNSSQP